MRIIIAILVALILTLQYRLWFGDGGIREVGRLREAVAAQRAENEQLKDRNRTLTAEVQDLKKGHTAIEERARTDLGMVGHDESFYQVMNAPANASDRSPTHIATHAPSQASRQTSDEVPAKSDPPHAQ